MCVSFINMICKQQSSSLILPQIHLRKLCFMLNHHSWFWQINILERTSLTTALHCKKSQSCGMLSSTYTKSFDSSTRRKKHIFIYAKDMKLWNKLIYQKPRNYYNLQFPSPPQPLLMIPLCPVISSASTMIFVNLSGSGIGWTHGVISNKPEVTKKNM